MAKEFIYESCVDFPHRYISPKNLFSWLQRNYSDYITIVGNSENGQPIYMLSLGKGLIKVLGWSQMHGNEANSTHAMVDLLFNLKNQPVLAANIFDSLQLDFIFMLNPDGAEKWTRLNAKEIDINRDFHQERSAEMKVFKKVVAAKKYDYALNLHEQRTIFTTDKFYPATLSFLAPSQDYERTITAQRRQSMAVIVKIFENLKELLPNRIARYSDEFYPHSLGDNLMKAGIPNILFEGGHYEDDYFRKATRKFYTIALYEALAAITELRGSEENWEKYEQIPPNKESHYDVIYRHVKLNTDYECILDVAVQYREVKREGSEEIEFVPIVTEVGNVSTRKGWREIDCTGKKFVSQTAFPKVDEEVNFSFE